MGRPRKRQFVEMQGEGDIVDQTHTSQAPESLCFLGSLEYAGDGSAVPYSATEQSHISSSVDDADPLTALLNHPSSWLLGAQTPIHGPPIDFANVGFGSSNEDGTLPPLDPIFQVLPPLPTPDGATDTSPCSCLSSIYLSLAALQRMPSDIVSALKTVRGAAAVAAQTIWCPQCGAVLLTTTTPLIDSFQNMMLLGTLLPVVAHAYQRLLAMVDKETNNAIAANETKSFSLHEYGGLCRHEMDLADALPCVQQDLLFNTVDMPPMQWRTTVRALLRVDIYGHESPGFKHKGLKDLVSELEHRQRVRHDLLDAAQAAGTLDNRLLGHGFNHNSGKKSCDENDAPQCIQMIKIAKHAIDQLLIA
jgi:hypothetical protein